MDDFCRCTPEEFGETCKAWHTAREAQLRDGWERVRWQTQLLIKPYVKGKVVLPLPWDGEQASLGKTEGAIAEKMSGKKMSGKAQMLRMAEVARRLSASAKS